ncbi:YHS domain-containing protein [Armatimonas sp.]|uniref:YHS domain-containing protein n=1 Tax=Armatimonas sp. TaxID=1872638 RepID=UPI00286A8CD3|nr:YHS domain-containing protein [Armatimonas sp.]
MTKLTFIAALAAFGIGAVAFAQDAAPKPAQRPGQAQGRNMVQVCAMKGEALKTPAKAESVEFNGKKVLFCCANCKAAFEKLDDAAKTKTVTKAGLISQKLTALKTIERVEKQLKELDGVKEVVTTAPAGKVNCAVTGEEIESVAKAAGKVEYKGKTYYFCCPGCIKKFNETPDKFVK